MFKKLFKCTFLLGLLALGGIIALQFKPVRDFVEDLGIPLKPGM